MAMIHMRKVKPSDYIFLYDLLLHRDPIQNISHKKMPTYKQHCAFNDSRPYKEDYIILNGKHAIGRLYFTKNREVGISIIRDFQHKGYASMMLKKFLKGKHNVLANIAPYNYPSMEFFKKHKFKMIQMTYKYD